MKLEQNPSNVVGAKVRCSESRVLTTCSGEQSKTEVSSWLAWSRLVTPGWREGIFCIVHPPLISGTDTPKPTSLREAPQEDHGRMMGGYQRYLLRSKWINWYFWEPPLANWWVVRTKWGRGVTLNWILNQHKVLQFCVLSWQNNKRRTIVRLITCDTVYHVIWYLIMYVCDTYYVLYL